MDPNAQIPLTNTLEALNGPVDRFPTNPALGQQITNPKLQSLFQTVAPKTTTVPPVFSSLIDQSGNPMLVQAAQKIQSGGSLTVPELKEFRSFIGRAMGEPQLVDNMPRADLKHIYGAMSQDLEGAANAAGPGAARAFEAANSYYRAGQSRIAQLEPLLNGSREQSFAAITARRVKAPRRMPGCCARCNVRCPTRIGAMSARRCCTRWGYPLPVRRTCCTAATSRRRVSLPIDRSCRMPPRTRCSGRRARSGGTTSRR